MNTRKHLSVLVLATAMVWTTVACGGDSPTAPAVTRNDPGTGTLTMKVTADIEGKDVPGGFTTEFTVRLRDAQDGPVSGAAVTIANSSLGTVTLQETAAGSGDYVAARNTFAPGDYELDVVKDAQNQVRGVVVGGMAVHAIMTPARNDTVFANQALAVTWTRPSEAAGADLETRDYEVENIQDAGSFTIAATENPPRDDQRIRIARFNRVNMAGGLLGSRLKLSIRNSVEPLVVQ